MRKVFSYITILTSLTACSQKKETTMINQNQNITTRNLVDELVKRVNHYPEERVYVIDQVADYCFFELLINDIPVFNNFDFNAVPDGIDINQAIFKSGQQKVTYKLYPGSVRNGDTTNYNFFLDKTYLKLKLQSYDKQNSNSDSTYLEYRTPETVTRQDQYNPEIKFEGTGKTFYENSFTINVNVPYELTCPFANAQDLRKIDSKKLEAKVLQKYQEIWNAHKNKQFDYLAQTSYNGFSSEAIGQYKSREDLANMWTSLMDGISLPSFQMQPIQNYKMEFFAYGRLVALVQNTTTDKKLRGQSALWGKAVNGKNEGTYFSNSYLYIPQGETEFKVY